LAGCGHLPLGTRRSSSSRAVTAAQLGLHELVGWLASIDPEAGPDLATCVAIHLPDAGTSTAAARVDYVVEAQTRSLQYTQDSVEQYFVTATRSGRRPTLNLLFRFDSGSTELTDQARNQLDEVGKALCGSQLGAYRFELVGHTDDVGSSNSNRSLSQRGAEAAQRYLASSHGFAAERIAAIGQGEEKPKMAGMSATALEWNRRVELEPKSRGTRSLGTGPNYACGR
jgi:outer membrane protein OmpA-like peptidoglycan-associated protein